MLIISRKKGESFLIDDTIEVTVLDVQNDKIKIGIDAPRKVKIIRNELKETQQANLDAVHTPASAAINIFQTKFQKKKIDKK